MEGYEPPSYGEAMADVYDEWYADLTDVGATVAAIARLAAGGRVLELGIGTGRLAIPLAEAGLDVSGIDVSPAMVARLRAKPGGDRVAVVVGDMARAEDLPPGPFAVVFVAFNTFFGLITAEDQARVLRRRRRPAHGGRRVRRRGLRARRRAHRSREQGRGAHAHRPPGRAHRQPPRRGHAARPKVSSSS